MEEMDNDRSGEVDFDEVTKASSMNLKPSHHLREIAIRFTRLSFSIREESFLS